MEGIWLVSYILLWLIVIAISLMLIALLRLVGQLHQRIGPAGALVTDNGPEIGERFQELINTENLVDFTHFDFPRTKELLIVFVSPNCPACEDLVKSLIPFKSQYKNNLDIIMVSNSDDSVKNSRLSLKSARAKIPYLTLPKLAMAIRIVGTPFGIWLDREGIVHAKGIINHIEHLESLKNARNSGFASLQEYLDSIEEQKA